MGFFSWTCAKTGLPIMADLRRHDAEMSKVLVVYPDDRKYSGVYDGYGRVDGEDIVSDMDHGAKLVLESFYQNERYADLKSSGHEPGQGFFHDLDFIRSMYYLAKEKEIDSWQYLARKTEYDRLFNSGYDAIEAAVRAPDVERCPLYKANELFDRYERAEDADDQAQFTEAYEAFRVTLIESLQQQPPLLVLAGLQALENAASRCTRRAVLEAWRTNTPATEPDWPTVLALPTPATRPKMAP